MRFAGMTLGLVLVAALGASAQPPGTPGLPPAANPIADPGLDGHLEAWAKVMAGAKNFSAKFEQTKTESTFKKERKYTGSILCMKPNLARMSLANVQNKDDFEAYICNGKSLFHYDWSTKIVTEIPLVQGNGESLMLDFLSGMSATAVKQRFSIAQFNPGDKNYVYFDIKPKLPKDAQEFTHIRLAVYGPNVPAPFIKYMPSQIYMVKPNDDTELWKLSEQAMNVRNKDGSELSTKIFDYEQPKEKEWQFKKAPAMPPTPGGPLLKGGTNLPPGQGAVKRP
jgi:TIGR03009 family protein